MLLAWLDVILKQIKNDISQNIITKIKEFDSLA